MCAHIVIQENLKFSFILSMKIASQRHDLPPVSKSPAIWTQDYVEMIEFSFVYIVMEKWFEMGEFSFIYIVFDWYLAETDQNQLILLKLGVVKKTSLLICFNVETKYGEG